LEDEYNVVLNNCEHFAMWVRYGKKDSAQVTRWTFVVAFGLLAVGLKLWLSRPFGAFFVIAGAVLLLSVLLGRFVEFSSLSNFGAA
jgi:hypothetical protein